MDDARYETQLRELRRELGRVQSDTERARKATAGLVVALVGLLGSLCLPWFMIREPLDRESDGMSWEGGIQSWFDGWLVLGEAVDGIEEGGWLVVIPVLGVVLLAVLVGVLLVNLGSSLAKAVTRVGWVGVVGLTGLWLFSRMGDADGVGTGLPVAVVASLVAALSAHAVRDLRPRQDRAVPSAGAVLAAPTIRATPPPED